MQRPTQCFESGNLELDVRSSLPHLQTYNIILAVFVSISTRLSRTRIRQENFKSVELRNDRSGAGELRAVLEVGIEVLTGAAHPQRLRKAGEVPVGHHDLRRPAPDRSRSRR